MGMRDMGKEGCCASRDNSEINSSDNKAEETVLQAARITKGVLSIVWRDQMKDDLSREIPNLARYAAEEMPELLVELPASG